MRRSGILAFLLIGIAFSAESGIERLRQHRLLDFENAWLSGSSDSLQTHNAVSWRIDVDFSRTPPAMQKRYYQSSDPIRTELGTLPKGEAYSPLVFAHGKVWVYVRSKEPWDLYQADLSVSPLSWVLAGSTVKPIFHFALDDQGDPFLLSQDASRRVYEKIPGEFLGGGSSIHWYPAREILPLEFSAQAERQDGSGVFLHGEFDIGQSAPLLALAWDPSDLPARTVRWRASPEEGKPYGAWSEPTPDRAIQLNKNSRFLEYQISLPANALPEGRVPDLLLSYATEAKDPLLVRRVVNVGGALPFSVPGSAAGGAAGGVMLPGVPNNRMDSSQMPDAAGISTDALDTVDVAAGGLGEETGQDPPVVGSDGTESPPNEEPSHSVMPPEESREPESAEPNAEESEPENPEKEKKEKATAPRKGSPAKGDKAPLSPASEKKKEKTDLPPTKKKSESADPASKPAKQGTVSAENDKPKPTGGISSSPGSPAASPADKSTPPSKKKESPGKEAEPNAAEHSSDTSNAPREQTDDSSRAMTRKPANADPKRLESQEESASPRDADKQAGSNSPAAGSSPAGGSASGGPGGGAAAPTSGGYRPNVFTGTEDTQGLKGGSGVPEKKADPKGTGIPTAGGAGPRGRTSPNGAMNADLGGPAEGPRNQKENPASIPFDGELKSATPLAAGLSSKWYDMGGGGRPDEFLLPWFLAFLAGLGLLFFFLYRRRTEEQEKVVITLDELAVKGAPEEPLSVQMHRRFASVVDQVDYDTKGWEGIIHCKPDIVAAAVEDKQMVWLRSDGTVIHGPVQLFLHAMELEKEILGDRKALQQYRLDRDVRRPRLALSGTNLWVWDQDVRMRNYLLRCPMKQDNSLLKSEGPSPLKKLIGMNRFGVHQGRVWVRGLAGKQMQILQGIWKNHEAGSWKADVPSELKEGHMMALSPGEETVAAGFPSRESDLLSLYMKRKNDKDWTFMGKTPFSSQDGFLFCDAKRCFLIELTNDASVLEFHVLARNERGICTGRLSRRVALPMEVSVQQMALHGGRLFIVARNQTPGAGNRLMLMAARVAELLRLETAAVI